MKEGIGKRFSTGCRQLSVCGVRFLSRPLAIHAQARQEHRTQLPRLRTLLQRGNLVAPRRLSPARTNRPLTNRARIKGESVPITFHIPGALREFTEGNGKVEIQSSPRTVGDALAALWTLYPGVRDRIATEQGQVREHVNLFVGEEDTRYI